MLTFPKINPNHKRKSPKNISKITNKVRDEVLRRSEHKCERCGRTRAYAFEMAHLVQASHGGRGDQPWNIVLLCGPSVNTGTCHNFADYTEDGRAWRIGMRKVLENYYERW